MSKLRATCLAISNDQQFQSIIIGLIFTTAIVMGLETSPLLFDYYSTWFDIFFIIVQVVFVFEIIIRLFAHPFPFISFFKNGWNRFDFAVVLLSLLPIAGPFALIARFARILRVARLVSSSNHLKDFIIKIGDAFDIMIQAGIVAGVFYYIYAVAGYHLFSNQDPAHWASFGSALLTLTKLATFQNSSEIIDALGSTLTGWIFAISFIILNIVLVVNFIAATTVDHILDHYKREKL